jgi:hypothetical protein
MTARATGAVRSFGWAIGLLLCSAAPAAAKTWFVATAAVPGGDGSGWSRALTALAPALAAVRAWLERVLANPKITSPP